MKGGTVSMLESACVRACVCGRLKKIKKETQCRPFKIKIKLSSAGFFLSQPSSNKMDPGGEHQTLIEQQRPASLKKKPSRAH